MAAGTMVIMPAFYNYREKGGAHTHLFKTHEEVTHGTLGYLSLARTW